MSWSFVNEHPPAGPVPTRASGAECSGWRRRAALVTGLSVAIGGAGGCAKRDADMALVVYCSVDERFGRQVLATFERRHGVRLAVMFDSEAGKTTGLVRKIELEAAHPRADVFWSSELFNTILLARKGMLAAYQSPAAADIPPRYRDPQHRWTAFGLRARVVAFDPTVVGPDEVPQRWEELARPPFVGRVALANPLFGTTRGHVAAMFAAWGADRTAGYLRDLHRGGVLLVDGNSAAVRAVMDGRAVWACTDTDDVWVARAGGASLDVRYLDMGDGGTLLIPNSVAVLKGTGRRALAEKLVDFLVSAEVERLLARSRSANVPVRPALRQELAIELPPQTTASFERIADAMDAGAAAVRETLIR